MTDPSQTYIRPQPRTRMPYLIATAGIITATAIGIGYVSYVKAEKERNFRPAAQSDTVVVPYRADSLTRYQF